MPGDKLQEPIKVTLSHRNGVFSATSAYLVGGKGRLRQASAETAGHALQRLLSQFREAGHARKRFHVTGLEFDFGGFIGQTSYSIARPRTAPNEEGLTL